MKRQIKTPKYQRNVKIRHKMSNKRHITSQNVKEKSHYEQSCGNFLCSQVCCLFFSNLRLFFLLTKAKTFRRLTGVIKSRCK